jgi:methylated-DNA-[protein]-cysteine S-methyltransferase
VEKPGVIVSTWIVPSPLGDLVVAAHEAGVCVLEFRSEWPRAKARLGRLQPGLRLEPGGDPCRATASVTAYFDGALDAFDRLPLDPHGTPFDLRVWRELRAIPPGRTISYRDLADRLSCRSGYRAVGAASGRNPLAIAVPCHRVVGADGGLRGYAGGLARKSWLLAHEAHYAAVEVQR